MLARTPRPPYYAAIFTSQLREDDAGYQAVSERMLELARQQPGFLGVESARTGIGITVSYWESAEAIRTWKMNLEHQQARRQGRERWYAAYRVRIARVERDYGNDGEIR